MRTPNRSDDRRGSAPSGPRQSSRMMRMLAVGLVAVIVPLVIYKQGAGASAATTLSATDGLPNGTVQTPYGPLTPLDRTFVTKVRLAGLWELPSGMMAMTH